MMDVAVNKKSVGGGHTFPLPSNALRAAMQPRGKYSTAKSLIKISIERRMIWD